MCPASLKDSALDRMRPKCGAQVDRKRQRRAPRGVPSNGWWAHQDSNLEPKDSLYPAVSTRSGLSLHPRVFSVGCGTLMPVIKGAAALR